VSHGDSTILELLRERGPLTINDLIGLLGVTATAVRQKLDRLGASGLIQRRRQFAGEGQLHTRGRPSFSYELSEAGRRQIGNNLGDLAEVLWEEVCRIADPRVRATVLHGVTHRLAELYGDRISGRSLDERMLALADIFAQRQIPVRVERQNGLPVLNVHGCPYPDLAQHDRTICEMETELFSKLVGQPIKLGRCQDHGCCTFQALEEVTVAESPV
jgi:DeoR family transcriptional regulator, suf operon transcriptional repressor